MERTNCYAYVFDVINNPITGEQFYTRAEAKSYKKAFVNQPGIFSGQRYEYDKSFIAGTNEENAKFVEMVKDDAVAVGLNFQEMAVLYCSLYGRIGTIIGIDKTQMGHGHINLVRQR